MQNNVILFEETLGLRSLWGEQLKKVPDVWVLPIDTPAQLATLVEGLGGDIAVIVVGNMIVGGQSGVTTVKNLRANGYQGPIIACSGVPDARAEQLRVGGDNTHEVEQKTDVVKKITELLPKK